MVLYDGGGSDGGGNSNGSVGGGNANGSAGVGGGDGGGVRVSVVTCNLVVYALHINYMGDGF